MPFPNQVNVQPAPAVAGDFATTNPRAIAIAGPGGLVAGAGGVTVGRFAWLAYNFADQDNAPTIVNSFASATTGLPGAPAGIVHREQQALITTYLAEFGMVIPAGFPVTVFNAGDFWVKNDGSTQVLIGQYAFARFSDGAVLFGSLGQTQGLGGTATVTAGQSTIGVAALSGTLATITGSIGPCPTTSFTGSISGNVLTVTAVASGSILVGGTLSGTGGGGVAAGTQVVSQLSGTVGGIGTYAVNIPEQTVTSTTMALAAGTLTVSAVTGTIGLGMLLTGTANGMVSTFVTAFLTGSGGTGTYVVSATQTIALNSTISGQSNVQTKFIAMSSGLAGELIKVSSWIYG